MAKNDFNIDDEIKKFSDKYSDLKVKPELFKSENGKLIILHFLEQYSGFSNLLIKRETFIPTVYPYIEFSYKPGTTIEQAFTLIAQDFQTFD